MLAHHFSHYYSRRCWRMVLEETSVISPSSPDHTKLSFRFQSWNCWGLCSNIDVGPPLFTLLQLEMPTDGARSDRCDEPHKPWSHQIFLWVPAMKLLGTMFQHRCWPTTVHTITAGDADGWCLNYYSWCDRPLIHGTWKQRFGFPSDFIRHPGIPHVVSVSPFVNNKNPEGNKCAQFNLPPCCHVSLSYVMGLDIELIHQRMQTTRLHASHCYHHYYCRYGNVDFMLFHNFTCYTNSLLSCVHVNTANPP